MTHADLMSRILIHAHMNDVAELWVSDRGLGYTEIHIGRSTAEQAEALERDLDVAARELGAKIERTKEASE